MSKKRLITLLVVFIVSSFFVTGLEAKKVRSKLECWYLWTGAEGQIMEDLITEFNKSQDKYEVKGLSVPDVQKIIVAIASGSGPDITDNFSSNVASYADKGILLPLDNYIKKSKYDMSDFIGAVPKTCQYKGKTYALPINVTTMMLFYNKKLFAEAGLTGPPKTDKELYEYAIKLTKLNSDKTIDVLGFPDFPSVYYTVNMSFALGGDFIAKNGKLTPDNPGTIAALKLLADYRKQFGVDNVSKFTASAKYLDPTDPFITGKQAMRIDGPWFGHTVKNVLKIKDMDYGVAPLPYSEGKPELARGGEIQSSIFFISNNSKNKEGAWAFLSWLHAKPQMTTFCSKMGNFPARKSCLKDPVFDNVIDFKDFAEQVNSPNLKVFPPVPVQEEYQKILKDEAELSWSLKKSPEVAMKDAARKANALK